MFTNTQIEEIRKKLLLKGIKDTQFPLADSLKGDETVAIVQQGINKQLGLKILLESVTKWSVSDFLNISKSNEDSYIIEEVLKLVTPINRKAGQVITFKDKRTGTWSIYQFKGKSSEDWFNLDYWDDILAKVDNHFKGLILNDCILNKEYPRPMVGDFAFVGPTLSEAVIYTCYNYGYWHNTEEPALDINEELKNIVEEIFNNVEKYPELVQLITSIAPIYNVDYNNYTADDFIKIKETIDKGGIITVSNVNVLGLTSYNVYNVASVSDYSIVLHTLVQNGMVGSSGGQGIKYTFNSVDINFIKTGDKNIIKKEFTYLLNGGGNKFLSDDGTYKTIDSANKQDKILLINHENTEVNTTITPNAFHVWGEMEILSIQFDNTLEDEFNEYLVRFSSGTTPTALTLPKNISWATPIDIKSNKTYELSVIGNYGCITEFDTYVPTISFTFGGTTYQADNGMTWREWVESDYNIDGYEMGMTDTSQEEIVFVREENSGWSGYYYYIGYPDSQTWVLLDDKIIANMDYVEVSESYGVGGGGPMG